MSVQSLSVVVPSNSCINACKFCCACMICEDYKNQMDENLPFYDLYLQDYLKRLEYCRDLGINTVMLTGNCEPQQNRKFLMMFGLFNKMLQKPFRNIEMQTTGTLLDQNYLRFLRNHVGVNTISLSVSSFNDDQNNEYIHSAKHIHLKDLCSLIKQYDFTLRLSINLTDAFEHLWQPEDIFAYAKSLGADQITFRVLYASSTLGDINEWINEHRMSDRAVLRISDYIRQKGYKLGVLPFGNVKYSVLGMSTVLDEDCMSTEASEDQKYYILRPDCKLYSLWDDPASLIF